jgi:CRISPR-associated endonuclease/helicase Cas3
MPEGTIHLSALMCGTHRSEVIAEIKTKLKEDKPIRVISTQLVEAGVDIDFPVVYRALAGLDSVAQAAGRCNREGKSRTPGKVHIFIPPSPAPPGLLRKGVDKAIELASLPAFELDDPEIFARYFKLFYSSVNDNGGTKLHEQLVKDVNPYLHFQFRSYAYDFKLIDDKLQRPVIVRYGKSEELIERLRFAGPTRELMRNLQRYTVNLSVWTADKMRADGFLEVIRDSFLVQTLPGLYNVKIGLDIYRESLPTTDLIQ